MTRALQPALRSSMPLIRGLCYLSPIHERNTPSSFFLTPWPPWGSFRCWTCRNVSEEKVCCLLFDLSVSVFFGSPCARRGRSRGQQGLDKRRCVSTELSEVKSTTTIVKNAPVMQCPHVFLASAPLTHPCNPWYHEQHCRNTY